MGSDNSIVKDYEEKIKDLINEYNDLSCDDWKEKFPEFINKEADIFSQIIKEVKISNISDGDFENLLRQRTEYMKELYYTKDAIINLRGFAKKIFG